jgi:hypothetical protein
VQNAYYASLSFMPPYVFLESWNSAYLFCTIEQHYPVHYRSGETHQFWFVSVGRRNVIKCVQLDLLEENPDVYNLCLYDVNEDSGELSDSLVSNNGDLLKLFSTIAVCLKSFFHIDSFASISFQGNTVSRNRLYRMWISKFKPYWQDEFDIEVQENNGNEFVFIIKKK